MKTYEVMYVVKTVDDEALEAIITKFNNIITDNGGTVEKTDRWGKKRLAYPILDLQEGLYLLVTFQAAPAVVKELDRVMKISDDILRHMITKKGE